MAFLKKDAFGNYLLIKGGSSSSLDRHPLPVHHGQPHPGQWCGTPQRLAGSARAFVSNHQTYFADVAAMYHIFNHAKWNRYSGIDTYWPILFPRLNVYFIAAVETMKKGILPRLFAYVGSVSIKKNLARGG